MRRLTCPECGIKFKAGRGRLVGDGPVQKAWCPRDHTFDVKKQEEDQR